MTPSDVVNDMVSITNMFRDLAWHARDCATQVVTPDHQDAECTCNLLEARARWEEILMRRLPLVRAALAAAPSERAMSSIKERQLRALRPPDQTDDEGPAWRCDQCKTLYAPNDLHLTGEVQEFMLCDACYDMHGDEYAGPER